MMKKMLIQIDDIQYETLRTMAFEQRTSIAALVREAIEKMLRKKIKNT